MAIRGKFIPKNPEKYIGDASNIFFRSLWEASCMKFFDSSKDVLRWGSEELSIPYLSPKDGRVHQYFPDFFVEYRDVEGNIKKEIVEVKPYHESDSAAAKTDRSKAALEINEAKWAAAATFCESRGLQFRVLTERSIFHRPPPKQRKRKNGSA
jgi:hypothetical protein